MANTWQREAHCNPAHSELVEGGRVKGQRAEWHTDLYTLRGGRGLEGEFRVGIEQVDCLNHS